MNENYQTAQLRLQAGGVLILDGGVSTELQRRGVPMGDTVWSGRAALDYWEDLVAVHRSYIDAGADIITTNTYASSRLMLEVAGLGADVEEINKRNVEAALVARERSGTPNVLVAGSMSHALPAQIAGHSVSPEDTPAVDLLRAAYDELRLVLSRSGVDVLLLEMMSEPDRMLPLFDSLEASSVPVWCGFSVKRNEAGELRAYHDSSVSFSSNIMSAVHRNFDVWGVMHTSADTIGAALCALQRKAAKPLMAYPDSGFMQMPNWQFVDQMSPEQLVEFAVGWIDNGTQIVGGCCGLGPLHIAAIARLKR